MALPTTPTTADPDPTRIRLLLYGTPGAGKTTFAARWFPESTLIIDLEGGSRLLPGQHFIVRPETYTAFQMVVNELLTQQHQFKAVVIDTADADSRNALVRRTLDGVIVSLPGRAARVATAVEGRIP